jgi:flagellar biosynthesis/type III secretory pathway protein FliH
VNEFDEIKEVMGFREIEVPRYAAPGNAVHERAKHAYQAALRVPKEHPEEYERHRQREQLEREQKLEMERQMKLERKMSRGFGRGR